MSFPHNLVLDSQPRFEITKLEFLNLYNFLINKRIFIKFVAKCSAFISLSNQVHVKGCFPIPLRSILVVHFDNSAHSSKRTHRY